MEPKKNVWQDKEFLFAVVTFALSILIGAFCAYAGYTFCMDNEFNPVKGVVFGFLLPFIYSAVDQLITKIRKKESCWLIPAFFVVVIANFFTYIPVWVGIIAMTLLIYLEILGVRVAYQEAKQKKVMVKQKTVKYYPQEEIKVWKDTGVELPEEKIYCERCFKEISEEEYEGNDGMCEDCYEDLLLGNEEDFNK